MALIGCPKLTLWVSPDVPDTDIATELDEILADGTSIAIWSDVRRLRYRESVRQENLVKLGETVRCDFNPGLFIARRMAKGSRLRLVVSAPNSIYFEKNYNSGGVVANETAKDARTAHVRILHDGQHASVLDVPIASSP
jgi:predicted acyl esterase